MKPRASRSSLVIQVVVSLLSIEVATAAKEPTTALAGRDTAPRTALSAVLENLNLDCAGTNVVTVCTEASLRAAIEIGGLITLCCNGTITLTNTLDITREVALDASGHDVTISGGGAVRLFHVSPGVRFSVTNLVLANGRHLGGNGSNNPGEEGQPGMGGAICNDGGAVELVTSVLTNNHAIGGQGGSDGIQGAVGGAGVGGAIFSQNGSLLLLRVNMSRNAASGGAGGLVQGNAPRGGDGLGGAVYSTNTSTVVVNSVLCSNTCSSVAGGRSGNGSAARGGALYQASGLLSISNCTLAANAAMGGDTPTVLVGFPFPGSAYGGAVAAKAGEVRIARSHLVSNLALGGRAFRHSGTGEAQGGAVFTHATLLAVDTSFGGNQALAGSFSSVNTDGHGGALYNTHAAVLDRCSIHSNTAKGGDAGQFGSTFVNYPGGHALGGGIFNSGHLATTNCTVVLNSAVGGGAGFPLGVPGSSLGGGIYNDTNGVATMMNTTIASNSVTAGMGWTYSGTAAGANLANQTNGTVSLRNSVLATGSTNGNAWGAITDDGFNISSDESADLDSGSSFTSMDPRLAPMAKYGGFTRTMALHPESPAIDSGGADGAPATDQRAFSRPFGTGVDIGAYEFHSDQTQPLQLSFSTSPEALSLTFDVPPDLECELQDSLDAVTWTEVDHISPFPEVRTLIRTIPFGDAPHRLFRLRLP